MLTVNNMREHIGRTVLMRSRNPESVQFSVKIADAKNSYGNIRFLIQPVAGQGEQWVEGSRLFL